MKRSIHVKFVSFHILVDQMVEVDIRYKMETLESMLQFSRYFMFFTSQKIA